MNDLINSKKEVMTSLEIAEVTGKNHFDVLKAIRNMEPAWEKVNQSKFALVDYIDAKGEKRPCYELTKTECLYVATKFNDEARAKLVIRWEHLEKERLSKMIVMPNFTDPVEAAEAWIEMYKQKQQQEKEVLKLTSKVEAMQPKANYYDTVLQCPDLVTTTQIAADYGMSAKAFNKKLAQLGIQRKVHSQWILYANYVGNGYTQSKTHTYDTKDGEKSAMWTYWTQKGRLFVYDLFKRNGILPLIER